MFKINGEVWRLALVPPHHYALRRDDGSFALGMCYDNNKTIYLSDELEDSPRLFKKVLCHEITHAAMFSYNVNLDHSQEELLADLIATYGEEIITVTNNIFSRLNLIL